LNKAGKIAVIGAGRGGLTMAADLTMSGFEIRLFQTPDFADSLKPLVENGGIVISGISRNGFAKPALITTNAHDAVAGADVVMIVAPAFAHESLMQHVSPNLTDGQVVVFNTGYFGALRFREMIERLHKEIILAETSTLVYLCHMTSPSSVHLDKVKENISFATLPGFKVKETCKVLRALYPQFTPVENVLHTSFENMNLIHPPLIAMNIAMIERARGDFFLYRDCLTETVGAVIEMMDEERRRVAEAFGVKITPMLEFEERSYGAKGSNIYEAVKNSQAHMTFSLKPPNAFIETILEDTPYLLVPIVSFGKLVGVPTPVTSALLELTSIIKRRDFWKKGATLENLRLNLSKEKILEIVS
jgi:opine dehydrogenase